MRSSRHRPHRTAARARLAAAAGLVVALGVVVSGCSRTPERSTEAFCEQVRSVQDLDRVLAGTDAGRAAEQVEQLRRLQEVAPTDIEPAVARLLGVADELAHALGTAPTPEAAADDVFRRHQGDLPAIRDAGTAIERYALTQCGLRLNPTGTTVPGSFPATDPAGTTSTTPGAG